MPELTISRTFLQKDDKEIYVVVIAKWSIVKNQCVILGSFEETNISDFQIVAVLTQEFIDDAPDDLFDSLSTDEFNQLYKKCAGDFQFLEGSGFDMAFDLAKFN